MTSYEPLTKGYVRKVVFWAGAMFALLVLGLSYKGSVDNTNALRAGCERGNIQREALYRNTLRDARARQAAAQEFLGRARRIVARQAQGGFADARSLIRTYASVAVRPGSVEQDCDSTFPLPFPLG